MQMIKHNKQQKSLWGVGKKNFLVFSKEHLSSYVSLSTPTSSEQI